jgi:hypothetical protein
MHKVLCCGGRDFADYALVEYALAHLYSHFGAFAVIHGNAKGADRLAAFWAKQKGLPVIQVDANWDFYDKRAGSLRNKWMLELCGPTYAVAFPGDIGTAHMVRQLEFANVTVWKL